MFFSFSVIFVCDFSVLWWLLLHYFSMITRHTYDDDDDGIYGIINFVSHVTDFTDFLTTASSLNNTTGKINSLSQRNYSFMIKHFCIYKNYYWRLFLKGDNLARISFLFLTKGRRIVLGYCTIICTLICTLKYPLFSGIIIKMITLISNKIRQNKNICTYLSSLIVTLLRLPSKLIKLIIVQNLLKLSRWMFAVLVLERCLSLHIAPNMVRDEELKLIPLPKVVALGVSWIKKLFVIFFCL